MTTSRKVRRWLSIVALAGFAFAQASVALAACQMDRGTIGAAGSIQIDAGCDGCAPGLPDVAVLDNTCVAHCTSDLQLSGATVVLVRNPGTTAALWVCADEHITRTAFESPPPRALPARILLHSFLI